MHAGFTEDAPLPEFRVLRNQTPQSVRTDASRTRDTPHLKFRSGRRDVRIESRTGRGYKIGGNRSTGIFLVQFRYVLFHAIDELLIRRTKVRGTRRTCIVARTCGGRSRVKVSV